MIYYYSYLNGEMRLKKLSIGILAHIDAGKTSTTERILFEVGAIKDLGSVDVDVEVGVDKRNVRPNERSRAVRRRGQRYARGGGRHGTKSDVIEVDQLVVAV